MKHRKSKSPEVTLGWIRFGGMFAILLLLLVFIGSTKAGWVTSGNNMYSDVSGNVGIGTTTPYVPLDVRRANPGMNQTIAAFTNPSNAQGSAATINLVVGSGMATSGWMLTSRLGRLDIDPISDMAFPAPVMTLTGDRSVGIGTIDPQATLDVNGAIRAAVSGPNNVVAAAFCNPTDAPNSQVSIDLSVGTAAYTAWRLTAGQDGLHIGNATVIPPAITIENSHRVGVNSGLSAASSIESAIWAGAGTIPMILVTGKNGVVTFGEQFGIYAWGGQKAGYFSGDVCVSGKVGIGTEDPTCQLKVSSPTSYFGMVLIENSNPGDNESTIAFKEGSDASPGDYWLAGVGPWGNTNDFVIGRAAPKFLITPDGYTGIGTTSPAFMLHVNGSAGKPGGGSWSSPSDVRLKVIKGNYGRGLSEIVQLEPVRYSYKQDNEMGLPQDKEYVGVTAQDVEHAIPEAVEQNEKGYLMVNNDPIIWSMVNAIKQLKAENDQLKQRLNALEQKVNKQSFPLQDAWR